jgi:hypothetical protein
MGIADGLALGGATINGYCAAVPHRYPTGLGIPSGTVFPAPAGC